MSVSIKHAELIQLSQPLALAWPAWGRRKAQLRERPNLFGPRIHCGFRAVFQVGLNNTISDSEKSM
uniref:Uncharacterized protein n=1 Tax=Anguilla anguilla TaxID=7936 RepID=A0A0E9SFE8_ANGAN